MRGQYRAKTRFDRMHRGLEPVTLGPAQRILLTEPADDVANPTPLPPRASGPVPCNFALKISLCGAREEEDGKELSCPKFCRTCGGGTSRCWRIIDPMQPLGGGRDSVGCVISTGTGRVLASGAGVPGRLGASHDRVEGESGRAQ